MLYDRSYMREPPYQARWSVTVILIIILTACYAADLLAQLLWESAPALIASYLALSPGRLLQGCLWQLVTFQFLHSGVFHLLINCAMLYVFGRPMEAALGRQAFVRLYFASGAIGGLLQVLLGWAAPGWFGRMSVVGASAGVFGLIAAFALLNRETSITTLFMFFLPITMRAKYLLVVEGVIAVLGLLDRASGVAHAAHLGGMLTGVGYVLAHQWVVQQQVRWPRWRAAPPERELVGSPVPRISSRQRGGSGGPEVLSAAEFISQEVDPILDKISAHGIQSLTERERKILELARAKMERR